MHDPDHLKHKNCPQDSIFLILRAVPTRIANSTHELIAIEKASQNTALVLVWSVHTIETMFYAYNMQMYIFSYSTLPLAA